MKRAQVNFRPWPETEKRLEVAQKHGLNMSEMINELICEHFKDYVENKAKKLSQLATASN